MMPSRNHGNQLQIEILLVLQRLEKLKKLFFSVKEKSEKFEYFHKSLEMHPDQIIKRVKS